MRATQPFLNFKERAGECGNPVQSQLSTGLLRCRFAPPRNDTKMNPMNIIIANWKMNPLSAKDAKALFYAVSDGARKFKNIETIICPPFPFVSLFSGTRSVKLGAQDLFWELQGAYTGEVSGKMLKDVGCDYVIVGHSERRQYAGESDELINAKLKTALKCNLTPVLCIGERTGEEIGEILGRQLKECLKEISKSQITDIIIAYEPVWAISTSADVKVCLPDDALSAKLLIKKILTGLYGRFLADKVAIIYGGSVDSKNAADYIKESQTQGLLVGGASLEAEEFIKIVEAVNNIT